MVQAGMQSTATIRSVHRFSIAPWLLEATHECIHRSNRQGRRSSSFWRISLFKRYMLYFGVTLQATGDLIVHRPQYRNIVADDSPLMVAASSGDVPTIRIVLSNRQAGVNDVTTDDRSALFFAINNGHSSAVEELLRAGADPNQAFETKQTSPLAWALFKRNQRMVRTMLRHGADPQFVSRRGWSVLFYLWIDEKTLQPSCNDFFQILSAIDEDFLKLGDYSLVDEDGWSLLSRAACAGTSQEIEFMIRCGADVYWKNEYDWSAIFEAIYGNKLDIVEMLLQYDRKLLQSRDVRGWTLLHVAVGHEHEEIVKYLLLQGFNSETRSWPTNAHVP